MEVGMKKHDDIFDLDAPMVMEGDSLADSWVSDCQGRYAICFANYRNEADEVCPGHIEFIRWMQWALAQPADDSEYRN